LAAFYFQTIPIYGVLANLVAVPLTTFLVMPAGMIGLLLMPLGLDGPVFQVMAWGVEGVLWTARTAAALPGASILVHQWPGTALAMLAFGGLWLALWARCWRWLGLLPCAGALVLVLASRPPDLLVDRALGMAAVRHPTDATTLIEWRRDRLVRETWLRHLGTAEPLPAPKPGRGAVRGIGCDHAGCIVELGQLRVSLARDAEAAVEDCGRVDLVIARAGPESCRDGGAMVGPWKLRGSGGLAISQDGGRLLVRSVAAHRGDWPWSRARVGAQSRRLNFSE
jgi:competence protein ComEC